MISKFRFTFMAFIMLVLLGFGFQNQANGQVGLDGLFCPAVPNETGWLETIITSSGANFTGSVIGTVEDSGADAVAGLDWQHVDATGYANNPTNEPGTQLVSWWTQKEDRNTYVQVTNNSDVTVSVHVRIHNESCAEIRDFCDTYTPFDTHEYNLGDLFANGGADIPDGNLQGSEGWLVVTAVKDCGGANELPLDYDYLTGQLIVHDADDYLYGANTYARKAICEDDCVEVQRVKNGSFQDGEAYWDEEQSYVTIAVGENFSPDTVPAPSNPNNSPNMAFVVANDFEDPDDDDDLGSGQSYLGGSFKRGGEPCFGREGDDDEGDTCLTPGPHNGNLADLDNDVGDDVDDNVALLESDSFEVMGDQCYGPNGGQYLTYNLKMFTPWSYNPDKPISGLLAPFCQNYVAVMLIREDEQEADDDCPPNQLCGTITDARCYQEGNGINLTLGSIESTEGGNRSCELLADSDTDNAFGPFEFDGNTGWEIGEKLRAGDPGKYRIHVVAAQTDPGNINELPFPFDTGADCAGQFLGLNVFNTGALVNNFQLIEDVELLCEDCLDGSPNAKLANVNPETLFGQFDLLPGNTLAGADVVHINFADDYGAGVGEIGEGPYRPVAAFSNVSVSIFDEFEQDVSCGDAEDVCFVRLGIDDALVQSDNFQPATPTPTPTITPTETPTPTPTPTPTDTPSGGGSSSCAIAGSPVQLGTALANVLIPLVPVAFAFGVRAVRRRKK